MEPAASSRPPGPVLFARYAYPPNELGYCGPADHGALLEYGSAGVVDPGLRELAAAFNGAWPYLSLIAGAAGIGDPLDARVVEAYWIGNELLDRIDLTVFGDSLRERFRPAAGGTWGYLAETIPAGCVPHHAFHVLGVYPWVGLLGSDRGDHPLRVLDRCRIRWGKVISVNGDRVVVVSRLLTWTGRELVLAEPAPETAVHSIDGRGFVGGLQPGEWVSLHWDWVCDRLTGRQLENLIRFQQRQVDITNHRLAHPGPAMVLG